MSDYLDSFLRAYSNLERGSIAAPDDDGQFERWIGERSRELDKPEKLAEAVVGDENWSLKLLTVLIGRVQKLADPEGLMAIEAARKSVLDYEQNRWEPSE